jgi:hypothetical protein
MSGDRLTRGLDAWDDEAPPCKTCGDDGSLLDPENDGTGAECPACGVWHVDFCPDCGDEYTDPCPVHEPPHTARSDR